MPNFDDSKTLFDRQMLYCLIPKLGLGLARNTHDSRAQGGPWIESPILVCLISGMLSWISMDTLAVPAFAWGFVKVRRRFWVSRGRFHKLPNSRKLLGYFRLSLGDILEDILRNNLREVSGNLRRSGGL